MALKHSVSTARLNPVNPLVNPAHPVKIPNCFCPPTYRCALATLAFANGLSERFFEQRKLSRVIQRVLQCAVQFKIERMRFARHWRIQVVITELLNGIA